MCKLFRISADNWLTLLVKCVSYLDHSGLELQFLPQKLSCLLCLCLCRSKIPCTLDYNDNVASGL